MTAAWHDLFNRIADGIQSDADERQLAELLRSNGAARLAYREFMDVHAALHWDSGSLAREPHPSTTTVPFGRPGLAAAVLTVVVLGGAAAGWSLSSQAERPAGFGHAAAAPVSPERMPPLATVIQTRLLLPADPAQVLEPGLTFAGGRISLSSGVVELRLRNGVIVVFEGPGELDLQGEMAAFLHDGSVVIRMPEGMSGFELRSATTDVLDLGTEFAVRIIPGNVTDVQVYDGAVIASDRIRPEAARYPKRLEAGEAVRFRPEPTADPQPLAYRPNRFVRRLPVDAGIPIQTHPTDSPASDALVFGRPQHDAIVIHRAPRAVVVDGNLDEWADAPGFRTTLDGSPTCSEWADGRMMFDDKCLYIAAHIGDPMPLRSIIDPEVDADSGWRGGAVQVRLSMDRRMGWPALGNSWSYYRQRNIEPSEEHKLLARNPLLTHLTMWFHAPTQTPCLTLVDGMLVGELRANPPGYAGAFAADADGKSYTMEYAIPWSLLQCRDDPPRTGDVLAAVWQVHWGDDMGRVRREHMVEIRNSDEPIRINVWERAPTWGRAEYR